ncbi:MAG: hypothetical protein WCW84_01880 [Sulfurimonas sp.]
MIGQKVFIVAAVFLAIIPIKSFSFDDTNTSNSNSLSIYRIAPSPEKALINSNGGGGLSYNSSDVKFKVETSADFVKTGAIVKINPFQNALYLKFGANYLTQNVSNTNFIKENVSQYSTALGVGYKFYNNLDLEVGSSMTEIIANKTNPDNPISNQILKDTYCQLAKRAEIPIGTIDVRLNGNQLYQNLAAKEQNYGSSFNYYPNKNIKLGYSYMNMQNNVSNGYVLNYGYFSTEYTNNISQNTYAVTVGFKAKFTDITNISSYKIPMNIKPVNTVLHKFDDMVLSDNMNLRM